MFQRNWRDERNQSIYNKLSLKELVSLSSTCRTAYDEVWDYLSVPKNLLRMLNKSTALDIQKFISGSFNADSPRFKKLKEIVFNSLSQKKPGTFVFMPNQDAICCYMLIADRSPDFGVMNVELARQYAKQQGYYKIADSFKNIFDSMDKTFKGAYSKATIVENSFANLSHCYLVTSDLSGLNLTGANLKNANMQKSVLANTNLTGANLTGADLSSVMIKDTNFSGANLAKTKFFSALKKSPEMLSVELERWSKQLSNHPDKKAIQFAMVNDLIAVANELPNEVGMKLLKNACDHSFFQLESKPVANNVISFIYGFFSHEIDLSLNQKMLVDAMKQLESKGAKLQISL